MDLEAIYANDASGAQTEKNRQDEGKAQNLRGRVWVLVTVSLGLICVLQLLFIIWMNITITAERDLVNRYKNTVQEFNHTINSLQTNYTDLRTEKDQLSQKNQESENKVSVLSAEKQQLQQKNQELERNVTTLSDKLKRKASNQGVFFFSDEAKSWSESRQFCRDRGADLVMIKTEEKQRLISSVVKERVWIGLTDAETEGRMKWVDNSPLNQGFWLKGEPNDQGGTEDCIELIPESPVLNNWNDLPCSTKRRGICEK